MTRQKNPRDRLAPEMLLYGFVRAVGRFTRSGLSDEALPDSDDASDLERKVLDLTVLRPLLPNVNIQGFI